MAARCQNARLYPQQMMYFVEKLRGIHTSGLGFQLMAENPNGMGVRFDIRHGVSLTSWGEKITVSLTPQGESTFVDVASECALPTQIVDWGKNAENVNAVFRYFEMGMPIPANAQDVRAMPQQFAAPGAARYCPACGTQVPVNARFCTGCGRPL